MCPFWGIKKAAHFKEEISGFTKTLYMTLDEMCTYFMDNGQIVMIEEDREGHQIIDKVKKSRKIKYDKIVILVNDNLGF